MTAVLEWLVDQRQAAGPILDQGQRPTCLSCAISAVHHRIVGYAKSIEYLHYASRKLPSGAGTLASARTVLAVDGQPNESAWPYDVTVDESVVSPIPPAPLDEPFHRADLVIDVNPQAASLIRLLHDGHLPVLGLETTPGFMRLRSEVLTEPGPHAGGHAVLLVGAAVYKGPDRGIIRPGEQLMCVQNSWGHGWGKGGHGLIGPRAFDDMTFISAHLTPP
ncbi:MAG: hypothetical protein WBB00_13215 [Mycobacterium sp.]